jgi:3'-5' exoribonuclease
MDSKMECMRAQIENDRLVDGCFTSYSPALERSALKKEKFLNPPPEEPPKAAAPQSQRLAPQRPPERPLFTPPSSPFADKLKQALAPAPAKQETT